MDKLNEKLEQAKKLEELLENNTKTVGLIKVNLDESGLRVTAGSNPFILEILDGCGCEKEKIKEIVTKYADSLNNELCQYIESSLSKKEKEILDKFNTKSNTLGFDDIEALMKYLIG